MTTPKKRTNVPAVQVLELVHYHNGSLPLGEFADGTPHFVQFDLKHQTLFDTHGGGGHLKVCCKLNSSAVKPLAFVIAEPVQRNAMGDTV